MQKIIRILILLTVFTENVIGQDIETALNDKEVEKVPLLDAPYTIGLDNEKNCSFLLPSIEYRFDDHLRHGAFLGIKKVTPQKKCDCNATLGGLCFVAGSTYRAAVGYYPDTRTGNMSVHYGYRYLFLYGELGAGYSFSSKESMPRQFFHFGPSIGFDLLAIQTNVGYFFTTERINGKSGAIMLSIVLSPWSLEGNKEYKKTVKTLNQSTVSERKSFRLDKG